MKKEYLNELTEIKGMVNKIKNLDEAISFEDNFENEELENSEEEEITAPEEEKVEEEPVCNDCEEDTVATIREIALKGMIKLCKTPEDEKYQTLKKIFQFCDKSAENKSVEKNDIQ